jgi:ribosomal protein L37AE/L43A
MPEESKREHIYQCPECGCKFTRKEGEPEVCKCQQCGKEVDTEKTGCLCHP